MNKRTRYIAVMIFIVFLCGSLASCKSDAERAREQASSVKPKTVVVPDGSIHLTPEQIKANGIQAAPVAEQELTATINAIGRVMARAGGESQVFSPFPGRLLADPARLPRIGSYVKQGAVIAEVEQLLTTAEKAQISGAAAQFSATAVQLQSTIDQARQKVAFQQTELERARRLYEGGVIALKQFQTAEFNLRQAQAELAGAQRAKAQYEAAQAQQKNAPTRAPIRAPISGTVVAADLTAGQQIDPSKSLLTIVDLSRVWIEVAVHESQLPQVRRAARVTFTTPANPERGYSGELVTSAGVIDPVNRQATAIFAVNNSDGSLKVGMTAEAHIPTEEKTKALLVPASAVLSDEGQSFVYVETEAGVFRRRTVTSGARAGDKLAVTSGLSAGEKVVTVGAQSLRGETLRGQLSTEPEGEKK